jgi:DNA-binding CsgD family transcriptional regulator
VAAGWARAAAGRTGEAIAAALAAAEHARARGIRAWEAVALHTAVRFGGAGPAVAPLEEVAALMGSPLVDAFATHAAAAAAADAAGLDRVVALFEGLDARLQAAEAAAQSAAIHDRRGDSAAAFRAMTRCRSLAASCEGARTPALRLGMRAPWLTAREHEVAALAAGGLTSRAIAEHLVVSPRTVESHLYRIYAKLGVSDRGQLAEVLGQA